MKVYICTDLEGISGITLFTQTREEGPAYERARSLLMGDVNAAVQGCLDGGASVVRILDGHGHPLNFVPEEMHPGAEYIAGKGFPTLAVGVDETFDCAMLIGSHAMCRTPDGVLYHTQNSRMDCRYWYNGVESGEIAQDAMIYGHFDIPVVMVSADTAGCREARQFLGENVVTVAVKEGYGRECCKMLAPTRAHELIREGAAEALKRIKECRPYKVETPLRARLERLIEPAPEGATAEEIDALPHVAFEKTCESQLDIYAFPPETQV
ncbi:MAG: M55 family metallopeptidase [Armatimonadia bacterium]